MQNLEDGHHHVGVGDADAAAAAAAAAESASVEPPPAIVGGDWENFRDEDDSIMLQQQQPTIQASEPHQTPFVGDKEPLSSLADEYKLGSPILLQKIKLLSEQYAAIRRTRGDGNCFFRSFMFAYLEHVMESQDQAEVGRIKTNVEQCRMMLQSLGYTEFTFEDFFSGIYLMVLCKKIDHSLLIEVRSSFALRFLIYLHGTELPILPQMLQTVLDLLHQLFLEQLEDVIQGGASISHDELVQRSRDQSVSDYVVMFFRFVTSSEIQKRSEFFKPFIHGLTNASVEQFCKSAVEPMGEESDHVHITALSDALGIPIRVVYLDRSSCDNGSVSVNHHDFIPVSNDLPGAKNGDLEARCPFITLLYRPGHYDILYSK